MSWSNKFFAGILAVAMLAAVPAHADECGVNLFNPQLLLQADFTDAGNNQYKGKWNGHLNRYVEKYPFGFVSGERYKITYKLDCGDPKVANQYLTFVKSDNTTVKIDRQACMNGNGTVEIISPEGAKIVGLKVETFSESELESGEPYNGEILISNLMVTKADVDTTRFISYNPCTRVATQTMLENSSYGTRDRLNYVANVITNLITQSKTNTQNIGELSQNKQTRPAEGCADGYDSCLLVKDANGKNVWYPIETCNSNGIPTFGVSGHNVGFGPGEPWGWKFSENIDLMCLSDLIDCQDNEWVSACDTVYDETFGRYVGQEIVFGTAQRVAIAESTSGTIVTLPNNVQSGDVCVCKATRYSLWNSDTSSYSASQNINTDKWFVAGIETSDRQCFDACGDYRGGDKQTYYTTIANSCMDNAVAAQMCRYHGFFNDVVNNYFDRRTQDQSSVSYAYGDVQANGAGWAGCDVNNNGVSVRDTNHCTVDQSGRLTWVIRYYQFDNYTSPIGYVYGFGGYASVPAGTATGDVVDVNVANVSSDSSGNNAAVCVIKGYKANSDASDTEFTTSKAYVYAVGEGYDNAGIGGAACTEASMHMFRELYADMGNTCFAY